jgi:hypothetical protein
MRIYKVSTIVLTTGITAVGWAPAESKAKKMRRALAEVHDLHPFKEVEITAIDVPGGKAGLLQWLNENHGGELLTLSNTPGVSESTKPLWPEAVQS